MTIVALIIIHKTDSRIMPQQNPSAINHISTPRHFLYLLSHNMHIIGHIGQKRKFRGVNFETGSPNLIVTTKGMFCIVVILLT